MQELTLLSLNTQPNTKCECKAFERVSERERHRRIGNRDADEIEVSKYFKRFLYNYLHFVCNNKNKNIKKLRPITILAPFFLSTHTLTLYINNL